MTTPYQEDVPVRVHLDQAKPVLVREDQADLFTVGQLVLQGGATPQRLLGPNPLRTRLVIRAPGAGAVWVGPTEQSATPSTGFAVMNWAGEELTINATGEVYVSTNVNGAVCSFLAEFRNA